MTLFGKTLTARARFALFVGLSLLPLLLVWWLASNTVIDVLRPLAGLVAGVLQLSTGLTSQPSHDWLAATDLQRASGSEVGGVSLIVPADELRRMLLSFPLFLALMAAPPRFRPVRSVLIGCAVLALLFCLSASSLIFNNLAVVVNHRSSLIADTTPPPNFTVTRAPFGEIAFFLSGFFNYLALQVLPLIAPVVLWAALNWPGLQALMDGSADQPTSAAEPG